MDLRDIINMESNGEPEIYRLLKIGSFSVVPENSGFTIKQEEEPQLKIAMEKVAVTASAVKELVSPVWNRTKSMRGLLIYPVIFAVSFLIFYSTMNFPSLIAQAQGWFAPKQDQQILGKDLAAYNAWISGYFYSVSNKDLLAANNDYDHDGLTNYDEFVMRTNPTLADSDTDGTTDGVELINSTNPWGSGGMTTAQGKLRDKIDLNMVSERITFGVAANKKGTVNTASADSDNFDLTKPGVLSIPKLNIQAPLVFSRDPSEFDRDLERGVIHYPGTALPGNTGTMYVSGHSSDYIWKHDKFATIFTKINYLAAGDDIFITVYGKDGKVYNYRYRVTGQNVYSADDQTQFIDNTAAKLNLSTCWPIGTSKNRMVVSATLSPL
ncbi:MAG: sortase [Candidatus Doudnabacteria bacterium]|nr:sortase [Candidatus Doudnabacteria bacterium]